MKEDGCKAVYILNDKDVYGAGLAKNTETSAKAQGITVAGNEAGIDPTAPNYRSQASKIKTAIASCSGGTTDRTASRCSRTSRRRCRTPSSTGPTASPRRRSPTRRRAASRLTSPLEDQGHRGDAGPEELPAGRAEARSSSRTSRPSTARQAPDPYAIYGYEAMKLVLDSIKRAGAKGNDRQAVIDAFFAHEGPQERARHVLDRQERRHDPHRLRRLHDQGRASWRSTR